MKNKTSVISFDCPQCNVAVQCTVDNWSVLCCQNCGKSLSSNEVCQSLEKIQKHNDSTKEQKQAAKILYIRILVATEKYSRLSGADWVYLLQDDKKYANKCHWEKFSGSEWVQLIIASPDFASQCNWNMLTGKDWYNLLLKRPEFASKCAWNTLDEENFNLLCKHSERFKPYLNLSDLPSSCFYKIVEKMNLGDSYDWSNISSGQEWAQILAVYPGLSKYCNWSMLNSKDWVYLLIKQQQFKSICKWENIKSEDWDDLLATQPKFMIYYPKRFKDIWNYENFISRSALGKVLSRFFVFWIANTFFTIFSFFSLWGDDGWFSFARENFLHALIAGGSWIVLYVIWAFLYSKAWAGEYKRWLQITTTFFMSACFYAIYSWTFFFSRCSFSIVVLTIIAAIFLYLPYKCSPKAQKILLLSSPVFLFFTLGILVPGQTKDYYQIGKQLESSPFIFKHAARVYYEKGNATDPEYAKWEKRLKQSINEQKLKEAENALSELQKINPFYSNTQKILATISEIKVQLEKVLAQKKHLATKDALQYFSERKYALAYKHALQGDMGNPKLLLAVAWIYEFCEIALQDITKADVSYYQAAQTGNAEAQCAYALFLCRHPQFVKKEKLKNPEFLLTSAIQQGYMDARLHLGQLLFTGNFVKKNISKAIEITLPIAKHNAKAAKFIAQIFADPHSGFSNKEQADFYYAVMMRLLIEGSENNNAESLYLLGESFEKGEGCDQSLQLAFNYFDRASALESKPAIFKLAQCYEHGRGTDIDYTRALELYQRLVKENNAEAYFALGNLYAAGLGCKKNEKLAIQSFEKALLLHYNKAADRLALLYYFETKIQNYKQAFHYANIAAEKGYSNSQFLLGNFYIFGRGNVSVDTKKAFEWYMKAAKQNHAVAQYNIGYMYENGDAGSSDLIKARQWFEKSAANGNVKAKEKLKKLVLRD